MGMLHLRILRQRRLWTCYGDPAYLARYDLYHLRTPKMDHLGLALIVGGAAFVVSGLIFLLPHPRKR
jgi:hypothetical protein